jgi:hypothetical protein
MSTRLYVDCLNISALARYSMDGVSPDWIQFDAGFMTVCSYGMDF